MGIWGKMDQLILHILLIYVIIEAYLVQSAPRSAFITQIPGFDGTLPSKHYAGYVTIDETHGKRLYYYFVLSERNPVQDPVVLWLNGGPGFSSFDGFVYEHGPFNFEKIEGGLPKLHLNPYSWSKVSNIIYLDSPTGVGMSYSENTSDYVTGDIKTTLDSHKFLLKWFELYPEFLSNPFFISGESYAGVYVPTLSFEVVKGIDAGVKPGINFQGYIVGNGVTMDDEFDGNSLVPFVHGMGLISDDLFKEVTKECQGNFYNPANDNCERKLAQIHSAIKDLNVYDILEPCYHDEDSRKIVLNNTKLPLSFRKLGETERPLPVRTRMFGRAWPLRAPVKDGRLPKWQEHLKADGAPCTDDSVSTLWLNNEAVRKAIHAEPISVAGAWKLCTDRIDYTHDTGSMIQFHRNLISRGYRALIYSGDHDMCVPYTGSEAWTRSLGYKIVDEWRPWKVDGQVAGFIQGYDNNLTFLTVKGSGHTVPEYKPKEALAMYSRWLGGKDI